MIDSPKKEQFSQTQAAVTSPTVEIIILQIATDEEISLILKREVMQDKNITWNNHKYHTLIYLYRKT